MQQRPLQSGRAAGILLPRPGSRLLPAPIGRRLLRPVAFKPDDSVDDPITRTKTKTVTKQQYARGHGHNKGMKGWKDAGWDLDTKTLDGAGGTNLRRLILSYGEMAQATYDNLVSDKRDPRNPRHGSCYDASGKTLLQNSVPVDSPVASKYTVTQVMYGQAGAAALKTDDADLNWIMDRLGLLSAIPIKMLNPLRLAAGRGKKPRPAFMGYIAKSKPEGKYEEVDVAVVFRGTIFYEEWENNFRGDIPAKWNLADIRAGKNPKCAPPADIGVHTGFMDIYTERCAQRQAEDGSPLAPPNRSPFEVVEAELLALMKESNVTTISTTGHSLGGGLCTLSAFHIGQYVEEVFQRPESERQGWATKAKPTVTSFAFASPRVGNFQFLEEFKRLHIRNLRICNKYDRVPQTPGVFGSQLVTGALDKLGFNLYNDLEGQPAYSFWRWYNNNITLPKSEWGSKLVESWQNAERALLSKFGINKKPEEVDQQITFGFWDYCHVGQILELDSLKGPGTDLLLKPSQNDPRNIGKFHNLEMYLYLVANYLPDAGTVKPEQLENSKATVSRRDPALVNKSDDLLDVEKAAQQEPRLKGTPACWWNLPFESTKDSATGKEVKISHVVDQQGKPTGGVMVLKDDGGVQHWVYGTAASS